jgi:hypothetical protein
LDGLEENAVLLLKLQVHVLYEDCDRIIGSGYRELGKEIPVAEMRGFQLLRRCG